MAHKLAREYYLQWYSDLQDAADHFSLSGKFDIGNLLPNQAAWNADHPGEDRLPAIPAQLGGAAGNGAIANYKEATETYVLSQTAKKAFKQTMIDSLPPNEFSIPGNGYRTQEPHELLARALTKYGTLNATDVAKLQADLAIWAHDSAFDVNVTRMQNIFLQLNRVGIYTTNIEKMAAFAAITPGTPHLTILLDRYKERHSLLADQVFDEAMAYIAAQLPNMNTTVSETGYAGAASIKQPSYNDLAASVRELQAGMSALLLRLPPPADAKLIKAPPATDQAGVPAATPNWKPPRVRHYCFLHGWQLSHAGPNCNFMLDPVHGYSREQLAADRPGIIDGIEGAE